MAILKIGLTGGAGSGKSILTKIWQENYNIKIIDTDVINKKLLQNKEVINELNDKLNINNLLENNSLNIKILRKAIFSDINLRNKLESIMHPKIKAEMRNEINLLESSMHYVVLVIPLLIEANFCDEVDNIVTITSSYKLQLNRLQQRDGVDICLAKKILDAQTNDSTRIKYSDYIIRNHLDIVHLQEQLKILHKKLLDLS